MLQQPLHRLGDHDRAGVVWGWGQAGVRRVCGWRMRPIGPLSYCTLTDNRSCEPGIVAAGGAPGSRIW
jgi:hypothetical protein